MFLTSLGENRFSTRRQGEERVRGKELQIAECGMAKELGVEE
jgi:hypothetical protein